MKRQWLLTRTKWTLAGLALILGGAALFQLALTFAEVRTALAVLVLLALSVLLGNMLQSSYE